MRKHFLPHMHENILQKPDKEAALCDDVQPHEEQKLVKLNVQEVKTEQTENLKKPNQFLSVKHE